MSTTMPSPEEIHDYISSLGPHPSHTRPTGENHRRYFMVHPHMSTRKAIGFEVAVTDMSAETDPARGFLCRKLSGEWFFDFLKGQPLNPIQGVDFNFLREVRTRKDARECWHRMARLGWTWWRSGSCP